MTPADDATRHCLAQKLGLQQNSLHTLNTIGAPMPKPSQPNRSEKIP